MYNSGRRGKRAYDGYGVISQADKFNQTQYPIPIVESFDVTDNSYVPLDDTAASTAGGQTIVVYGSGFAPGATIMVGGSTIGSVTYLDQGRLTFTSPANVSGSYTIIVMNANGGTGILVPGLVYSGVPTWSTSAGSVGSVYETTNVSSTFVATGDAPVTYSVLSGSLPPGTSLSATGVLSGSAPVESGSTTYSFTIRATDGQLQDSDRSFSLTVNTDVVTWSTPTNNQIISGYEYAPISNVTASATSAAGYGVVYSANAVPTGITVNANTGVISGTVNTVGNTFTRLTATANTTTKTAIRDVVFNINPDVVTWSSPADAAQYTLSGGSPISNVSLSATSAAGFGVQYTANALPSGLTLSGSTISGTPDTAQTVFTLLTATANTTNRTATRTISWTISLGDLNWKNTTLALNATQPTTAFITDSSNNNFQLSIVGDTRPSNFDPYMGGYYSNYFDGSGDYLSGPNGNAAFQFGTGDFTIEAWVYLATGSSGTIFDNRTGTTSLHPVLYFTSTTTIQYYVAGNAGINSGSYTFLNKWVHVALCRASGSTRMFFDGVQTGSTYTDTNNYSTSGTVFTGAGLGVANPLTGYISNLRVIKGTALYTTNFTPSTSPLTAVANTQLLTCQSNGLIDKSFNNFTITKNGDTTVSSAHPFTTPTTVAYNNAYSLYFKASTGDNITYTASSSLLGAGDWTIETWAYALSLTSFDTILQTTGNQIILRYNSNTGWQLYYDGVARNVTFATSGTNGVNRWTHHAVTRSGSTIKWFINGVLVHTGTSTTDYTGVLARLGSTSGSYGYNGYISNMRMVKGTSLYNSDFTPSTSPLTNISGTTLLTNSGPLARDYSNNNSTVALSSTAAVIYPSEINPFTTTANTTITSLGSAYFSASSSYLTYAPAGSDAFGTGDFTVECWVNLLSQTAVNLTMASSTTNSWEMLIYANQLYWHEQSGNLTGTGYGNIPSNSWNHVACTRSGTTFRWFVNGIQVNSTTTSFNYSGSPATRSIGPYNGGSTPFLLSDFRIIKGTALYTTNFLPPQIPLTPVANTQLLTVQTNGDATNNGFVDQSSFNNIITRTGNATQGTFSPYSQNGWSNYFDGTDDALTTSSISHTGNFTIEFWMNTSAAQNPQRFATIYNAGSTIYIQYDHENNAGDKLRALVGGLLFQPTNTITPNVWHHVALVRNGSTITLYCDGVSLASGTDSSTVGGTVSISATSTLGWAGYLSNLRVVNGTALYTSAFTPPTGPLSAVTNTALLTCQDNRFIDKSPNNYTITRTGDVSVQAFSPFGGVTSVPTSYSVYFDGTGDYLQLTEPSPTASDVTVECWIYPTSTAVRGFVVSAGGNSTGAWAISISATNTVEVWVNGYTSVKFTTVLTVTDNTWNHLALVKTSGVIKIYVNGVLDAGSFTQSGNFGYPTSTTITLGAYNISLNQLFFGYISNFRYVQGTALYSGSTITVPTSPLTAVSGTQVLTCQSATLIDNSTNYFTITATGDSKPLPFNPFGQTNTTQVSYSPTVNGGSMYFDGTGDKLTVANYPTLGFKANDFTIQCWFYTNAASTEQVIMTNGWSSYAPWLIRIDNANTLRLNMSLNGGSWTVNEASLGAVTPRQWYHVAVTRTSGVIRGFTNGIQTYTTDLTTSTLYDGSQALTIGGRSDTTAMLNGYISDAQLINGFSLYRANFVPPVAPATPTYRIGANTASSTLLLSGTSGGIIDMHGTNNLETVGDVKIAPENPFESGFYSVYSDGNADYLTVPSATWTTLTGTFTVEFWALWTMAPATSGSFMGVQSNGGWTLYNDNTRITPNIFGTGNIFNSTFSPSSIIPGKWYHIAVTRDSSNLMTMWVDGVSVGSTTTSASYTQGAWAIHSPGNVNLLNGFISNLRVTNTTLYTTTFTPPTSPLTAVSGTQLLTCQSRNFADNSTNAATLTAFNTVAVRSFNPFKRNTGQSYFFDGTGDYLSSPASPQFAFGTGDYTIEAWVYRTDSGVQRAIVDLRGGGSNVNILFYMNSSNQLVAFNSTTTWITSTSTIPSNQWTHVAITRSGTSVRLFINGVIVGTATNSDNNVSVGAVFVGRQNGSTTNDWLGYIDDVRITRGVARYTSNNQVNLTSTFEVK